MGDSYVGRLEQRLGDLALAEALLAELWRVLERLAQSGSASCRSV